MGKLAGRIIGKSRRCLSKNGSLLLAGGAIVGLGASVIFVAKGQKKADLILAERDEAYRLASENPFTNGEQIENPPSLKEKLDLTWQCYIPAGISIFATLVCIIGSQYVSRKQVAALMGSLAFVTANRDQLEAAIKDKYGEEVLDEIKSKLAVRKPEKEVIEMYVEDTGLGNLLVLDGYSGRLYRSSKEAVLKAQEDLSEQFKNGYYVCLNDYFTLNHLRETHMGWQFGWPSSDDYYDVEEGIVFDNSIIFDEEYGEEILVVDYKTYPMECWMEL